MGGFMRKIWAIIGLSLLLGGFQNCGQIGFDGQMAASDQQKSLGGKDDPSRTSPPLNFPSGSFKIVTLLKKNLCRSTNPTMACPAWEWSEQQVSHLNLIVERSGAFTLKTFCRPRSGQAIFERSKEGLLVTFKERSYLSDPPVMACPEIGLPAAVYEAEAQVFKSKYWLEKGVHGDGNQTLHDGNGTYLILARESVKPNPVTYESFTISQIRTDKLLDLGVSLHLTIDSNRNFSLSSTCYEAKGTIPVVGQASNGIVITVKVAAESAQCPPLGPYAGNYWIGPYRDKAIAIFKGAILEQISATGDNYRRLVDKNGYYLILKRNLDGTVASN
jgi:hypothetical protein